MTQACVVTGALRSRIQMGSSSFVNWDLREAFGQLVDHGYPEPGEPGYQVAKRLITLGFQELSTDEQHIYVKYGVPDLEKLASGRRHSAGLIDTDRLEMPEQTPTSLNT